MQCFAGHGMLFVLSMAAVAVAAEPEVTIPLAAPDDAIGLSVTPGGKPSTQIVLEFADGGKKVLTLAVRPQTGKRRLPPAGRRAEGCEASV